MSCTYRLFTAVLLVGALTAAVPAQSSAFRRGDANLDGSFDISDGIFTVRMIFLGDPSPGCDDTADVDDDGALRVTDAIYSIRFLFRDGFPPPPPFGVCGVDPTPDSISCESNPNCLPELPCLDQQALDEILAGIPNLAFSFCIPAGLLDFPTETFDISVCPADGAQLCGATEQPGCPIEITGVKGIVNASERKIALRFEGRVDDLPIVVTEKLFNTSATCLNDFHGQTSADPFSFELVVPLEVEERAGGELDIVGIGEGGVENVNLKLTASGGLLCRLFQAGQGAFISLLLAPLDEAAKALTASLSEQLVGLRLCVKGG